MLIMLFMINVCKGGVDCFLIYFNQNFLLLSLFNNLNNLLFEFFNMDLFLFMLSMQDLFLLFKLFEFL